MSRLFILSTRLTTEYILPGVMPTFYKNKSTYYNALRSIYFKLTLALLQMSKRSCLIIGVVVAIIAIILLACCGIFMLFSSALSSVDFSNYSSADVEVIKTGGSDKIAVIYAEGVIMDSDESGGLFSDAVASSGQITTYLDSAMDDDNVKAVILNINSPGGDVYASDVIYEKIKEVQADGIKVVTLMRNTAASGGYYIAAPTDKIIAHETTITGSIGVRMDAQSLDGLYEKIGIETRTITNSEGDYKDLGKGLFDDNPNGEEDKIMQRIVDETFDEFITVVADGRGMDRNEVIKLADGRIYTGKQALDNGLIDELGGFDDAVKAASELAGISDPTIIEYKKLDFWSSLFGYVSSVANPTAELMSGLDATPGVKLRYLYVAE